MLKAGKNAEEDAAVSGEGCGGEVDPCVQQVSQQIVEIVSDSGEGAQTTGQLFATLCAKAGNGVWTVEIIPAEIEPPARSRAGASGIRVRFGTEPVANMGDEADLVVAFNEQVLYSRIDQGALRPGTVLLIDDKWTSDADPRIPEAYDKALADFRARGYEVRGIPIEAKTSAFTDDPRRGKNMWVLGPPARQEHVGAGPAVRPLQPGSQGRQGRGAARLRAPPQG
jgi:2-oxoglutarate ferredoxin oxidoreductase subunit alpha